MGINDVGDHPGGELPLLVLPFPIGTDFAVEVRRCHPPERIRFIPRVQPDGVGGVDRALEIGPIPV